MSAAASTPVYFATMGATVWFDAVAEGIREAMNDFRSIRVRP
jgi:hypothetical protein